MNIQRYTQQSPVQQQGAVLLVALILLVVLTLMGISAMQTTRLQTKMANNAVTMTRALQRAEIGVAVARSYDTPTILNISRPIDPANPATGPKKEDKTTLPGSPPAEVITIVAQDTYIDQSGEFGVASARLMHFVTKSTGYQQDKAVNPDTPTVVLRGGMSQPVPTSKNIMLD